MHFCLGLGFDLDANTNFSEQIIGNINRKNPTMTAFTLTLKHTVL